MRGHLVILVKPTWTAHAQFSVGFFNIDNIFVHHILSNKKLETFIIKKTLINETSRAESDWTLYSCSNQHLSWRSMIQIDDTNAPFVWTKNIFLCIGKWRSIENQLWSTPPQTSSILAMSSHPHTFLWFQSPSITYKIPFFFFFFKQVGLYIC